MKTIIILFSISFLVYQVFGQNDKVSSKLDLEESKEDTEPRIITGNKSSPKIQGVRVTVDTGNSKNNDTNNKESVEIVDNKSTKRVGIHTDITFEITDDKNESNGTSSEQGDKDDNASVPIFKGRTSTQKPRQPYNPKVHPVSPNYPGYHHNHYIPNVPVFPRTNDEGIYRSIDNWSNFIPITGVWTTERTHRHPQRPNSLSGFNRSYQQQVQGSGVKYCVCPQDNTDWGYNNVQRRSLRGNTVPSIDDKISSPFSKK